MTNAYQEARSAEEELEAFIDLNAKLGDEASGPDQEALEALAREVLARVTRIEQAHPTPWTMDVFFTSVGEGVARAQAHLDDLSYRHAQDRVSRGHWDAPPVTYHIGSARAELRFELETLDASSTGVVFHRRTHQARETLEHRVRFEVAMLTPPPEVLAALQGRPLTFRVVDRRKEIRGEGNEDDLDPKEDALRAALWMSLVSFRDQLSESDPRAARIDAALENDPNPRILVMRGGCLVFYSREGPSDDVFFVSLDPSDPRTVDVSPTFVDIPDQLRRFVHALLAPPSTPATQQRRGAVAKALKDALEEAHPMPPIPTFQPEHVRKILRRADDLAAIYPRATKDSRFESFLVGVASSLDEAQRALDRASREYLEERPVIPSAFRIPSVDAEISFAVESTRGERINALVYRQAEQERDLREQKLGFEIVSMLATAEQLEGFQPPGPGRRRSLVIVSGNKERDHVHHLLTHVISISTALNGAQRRKLLHWNKPKIFEILTVVRATDGYFLFRRHEGPLLRIDSVFLGRTGSEVVVHAFPSPAPAPPELRSLFDPWLSVASSPEYREG